MKLGEMKTFSSEKSRYYIVVEEWNYPVETGRNIVGDFDNFEDAMDKCRNLAEAEVGNFEENCKVDCLDPTSMLDGNGKVSGYVISPKNGLDEWVYMARIIEVEMFGEN